jgi:hypothetical protein
MKGAALVLLLGVLGCHRTSEPPSSCVIMHDGGVTQCFEDIGSGAKQGGEAICDQMHGDHAFRVGQGCPAEGIVASCTKQGGTELERVERCYHDPAGCEARCQKSGGVLAR